MAGTTGEASGPRGRIGLAGAGRADAAVAVTDLFRDHHLELVRRAKVARKHAPALTEPAAVPGPETAAGDRGELAAALRRVPRRQREVLVLRYYLDLDVAEIASTLGINPGSVRAANTRGLAALARELKEG